MSKGVVVWSNKVDNKYECRVEFVNNDNYAGVLKLDLNGVNLKSKDVVISYGARFGPDIADVNDWSTQVIEWVDEIEAETKKEKS